MKNTQRKRARYICINCQRCKAHCFGEAGYCKIIETWRLECLTCSRGVVYLQGIDPSIDQARQEAEKA